MYCTITYSMWRVVKFILLPLPHLPLDDTSPPLNTLSFFSLAWPPPLYLATMSDTDDFAYYQGYKAAVLESLPIGIAFGEGQETRRYLSNF
jgi:hypothetical protein